jgi:GntR family transcriptional regulator
MGRAVVLPQISAAPDPLYLQVYAAITSAIAAGSLRPGDRLPTERSFGDQFGVSRATVRRALRRLTDEGVIEAFVGRGSFVTSQRIAEPPNLLMSFTELAAARGLTPSAIVLRATTRAGTPEEISVFELHAHALIVELERVRLLDQAPVAVDRMRVPLELAPNLATADFATASVYSELERAGAAPVRGDVTVTAVAADATHATALGIETGDPTLVCTTMSRDALGRLVEIDEIAYRADRYRFRATVVRPHARSFATTPTRGRDGVGEPP